MAAAALTLRFTTKIDYRGISGQAHQRSCSLQCRKRDRKRQRTRASHSLGDVRVRPQHLVAAPHAAQQLVL